MNILLVAVTSILLSVAAQFCLKAGMSSLEVQSALAATPTLRTGLIVLTNRYVLGGFLLYGLGAVIWLAVLARWDVSKAYPLVGLGFVLTLLVGLIQGEQIGMARTMGVLLIAAGVYLVSRS